MSPGSLAHASGRWTVMLSFGHHGGAFRAAGRDVPEAHAGADRPSARSGPAPPVRAGRTALRARIDQAHVLRAAGGARRDLQPGPGRGGAHHDPCGRGVHRRGGHDLRAAEPGPRPRSGCDGGARDRPGGPPAHRPDGRRAERAVPARLRPPPRAPRRQHPGRARADWIEPLGGHPAPPGLSGTQRAATRLSRRRAGRQRGGATRELPDRPRRDPGLGLQGP